MRTRLAAVDVPGGSQVQRVDLIRIEQAWREAADADLIRALCAPADYPRDVFNLIEQESIRRGVDASMQDTLETPSIDVVSRCAKAFGHFMHAPPMVAGGVLGAAIRLATVAVQPSVRMSSPALFMTIAPAVYALGLCLICLPLRRYRVALLATAGAYLGMVVTATLLLLFDIEKASVSTGRAIGLTWLLVGPATWTIPAGIACVATWYHNAYWPVYPPGHCKGCGYCLRSLPEQRCPECGRPFERCELPTSL